MARVHIAPEDIFLNRIKSLIKKNLIENRNVKNGHYYKVGIAEYIHDVQMFGQYLLNDIESMEHLVKPFEEK